MLTAAIFGEQAASDRKDMAGRTDSLSNNFYSHTFPLCPLNVDTIWKEIVL